MLLLAGFSLCMFPGRGWAEWSFDWLNRVDREDKPAGIYEETPFPITESSTSYVIRSDEYPEGRTYQLGQKYYVDGGTGNDANSGLTLSQAKKTIGAAVQTAGSGNRTIIVRGAHDGFNGVYVERVSFGGLSGAGDTNRLTLVGYGQERPVLDGDNTTYSIITRGDPSLAYVTVQRLKLQNTQASGVRLGWDVADDKRDRFFNCIDIWFYACGNNDAFASSGNCYYLNADDGYVSHCLFERSLGHGVKIGDGASRCTLEWSVSRENGWWPGKTNFVMSRTVAMDLPSDRDTAADNIVRYNIISGSVSHGLQLRKQANVTVHHNEVVDFGHGPGMTGSMGGVEPHGILIFSGHASGRVFSNLVRDPDPSNTNGCLMYIASDYAVNIDVFNNLLYGSPGGSSLQVAYGNVGVVSVLNNTIYQTNAAACVVTRAGTGIITVKNNLLYQEGSGACLYPQYTTAPAHGNNLFYAPRGRPGVTVLAGEIVSDPQWERAPRGPFGAGFARPTPDSPALGAAEKLSTVFATDFHTAPRSARWDIGAIQGFLDQPPPLGNFGFAP